MTTFLLHIFMAGWALLMTARPLLAQPVNDSCDSATAIAIAAIPYSETTDTSLATTDTSDPIPSCGKGSRANSVWYRFTAPANGNVSTDTLDSDYDTILSVYDGTCAALRPLPDGCNDDDPFDGAQSRVEFPAVDGVTYYFLISAFEADGGSLTWRLRFFLPVNTPTVTPTPSPMPSPTSTAVPSPSSTASPIPTTASPSATPDARTPTRTPTPPVSPTPTTTSPSATPDARTPTRTPTPSAGTVKPTETVPSPPRGDANCDGRISAADLTALVVLIVDGERAPCGRDDANGDGELNADDLTALTGAIFQD